ncbi:MAG: PqqD family protein [Bacteroidetes bacterium]|nr:PqqD family protein [Bacteroidota bacterium]
MNIKKNIALSDSGFVFDPSSGDSFSTNPIGLEIIKLMKNGKSADEIKKLITSSYMIDDNSFEKDLYDFVNMLQKLKIAEGEEKK